MRDWLDEGHLAWFVIDVVARIDTAAFHARHPNDGPGRPAYNPDLMLALLFYAYGMGVRSSRRIEALCRTDAAFRVIAAGATPDHATIARFLVDHERSIEDSFVEVLRLCAAAGLVSVGIIAIDGTKIGANAALDTNRGRVAVEAELGRLRGEVEAMLADARATDAAEDAERSLFGLDRLPVELASRSGRLARLEAALAIIEAEEMADAEATTAHSAKVSAAAAEGRRLHGRMPKDPHANLDRAEIESRTVQTRIETALAERARARADKEAQAQVEGRKLRGRKPNGMRGRERHDLEQTQRHLAEAKAKAADAVEAPPQRAPSQRQRPRQSDHEDHSRLGAGLQRPGRGQRAPDRAQLRRHSRRQRRPPVRADGRSHSTHSGGRRYR
jgi:transposase